MRQMASIGALIAAASLWAGCATAQDLKLNEKDYYETRGVNVLVFSNWYDSLFSDSKISGVEVIHHGQRTVTNGDVRLDPTPGQWDAIGMMVERKVDKATGVIEAHLRYKDYDFDYIIRSEPSADGMKISVILDKPLPAALVGKAGFNLEFLPSAYFRQSFMADGKAGSFPLYPASAMTKDADGKVQPLAMASADSFVFAPEDASKRISLTSKDGKISLFDGRNQAQNGWFVARTLIPENKTGTVIEWTMTAHSQADWVRPAVITHSQLGYAPAQKKVAVVELDPNDTPAATARLLEVGPDGKTSEVMQAETKVWGKYLRYNYRTFDFSSVKKPGLYVIEYGGQRTSAFRIAADIYGDAWHPTMDVYFPVAMDHMFVNEAYRVWHGDSHRDDALQAPTNHEHVDLYAQGPTTDTRFKPLEHIPGLNVGGWYDAGDFDIRTQTQYAVVRDMAETWETFKLTRDTTLIDHDRRYVDMHVPDGKPDLLQQIEHGTIQLVAQFKAVGHALNGIVEPDVAQYTHLGDAVTKTDNLIYDPSLKPGEVAGSVTEGRSGVKDDRWAFTNKSTALNYGSIAALAAASRALKGHNDALAKESLDIATRIWAEEQAQAPNTFRYGNTTGGDIVTEELTAAVELLIATGKPEYAKRIEALWPQVETRFGANAMMVMRALPYMPKAFKGKVAIAVKTYKLELEKLSTANPFGVPITEGGWAGSGTVVDYALTVAALNEQFPDIIGTDAVFRGLDFLYGTHPGSNLSLVSGVGAHSKEVAYGMNRADFSFIAGGVVPGVLVLKPDFPENKEDWPFFWGENEYVINVGASYVLLVNRAHALTQKKPK